VSGISSSTTLNEIGLVKTFGSVIVIGQIDVTVVAPAESLFDAHLLAVPGAARIEPSLVVEPHRVDHQRVAIPSSD
jgi:hypothetical protein